ncbi:MAG TPA: dihydropteroate synthase [Candidatus Acidoferrales bacterium]|nr:dihydropteroate synthase [Candidatus Acidoferrales bacterium]
MRVRERLFTWGQQTYVMGIVNATPDSFSGDGRPQTQDAIAYALEQRAAGAELLDVGAESTRPGHAPIPVEEELARLIPVIGGLRERAPDAVISVDTFKSEVFRAAHAAGADLLNSIWGLDDALLEAAVACDVPVIVMHNKRVAIYERDVVDEVLRYLEGQAARATRAGIPRERIILDPGIGFGKFPDHNLAVLGALDRVVALGFPTLLGASRKSTIGLLTGKPVEERVFGTAAAVALAVAAGIDIVRVHDVAAMRDAVAVADAVVRGWRPQGWT